MVVCKHAKYLNRYFAKETQEWKINMERIVRTLPTIRKKRNEIRYMYIYSSQFIEAKYNSQNRRTFLSSVTGSWIMKIYDFIYECACICMRIILPRKGGHDATCDSIYWPNGHHANTTNRYRKSPWSGLHRV